ncbi:hypothetical protein TCDM_11931 [Trypanosoma cruzi Dm28c]|uniref:Uncharacterized protein n=1 Tax=Trypanosoma cruzi Dm28c TaxID=1416333 RepID=V5B3N2_TRYCR|nr:hypothetical protein TCDM_11931 [Trypanosoma cruzi Dm28c]
MVNFTSCVRLSLSSASRRASVSTCVSTPFGVPLARGVIVSFSFIVPTLPEREHTFVKRLSNELQRLVRSQVKNFFKGPLVLYVIIRLLNKHLHRHIVVFHQRPPCRPIPKEITHPHFGAAHWSTAATIYSPPHVELQRRNHHKRCRIEVPSQRPCGEASHSHRSTAASRCRWLQRTVAAVSSRSPNGVGRGTRTARWSVRHAAALQRLSVKQPRPTTFAATQGVQPTPTPPHHRPFSFCFIHVVGLFAPSPTPKISAHLHKRKKEQREKEARSHRLAAGQHSPPPTTIATQETAVTSQSQHHNAHRIIAQ